MDLSDLLYTVFFKQKSVNKKEQVGGGKSDLSNTYRYNAFMFTIFATGPHHSQTFLILRETQVRNISEQSKQYYQANYPVKYAEVTVERILQVWH
jgi:hypothetical protein